MRNYPFSLIIFDISRELYFYSFLIHPFSCSSPFLLSFTSSEWSLLSLNNAFAHSVGGFYEFEDSRSASSSLRSTLERLLLVSSRLCSVLMVGSSFHDIQTPGMSFLKPCDILPVGFQSKVMVEKYIEGLQYFNYDITTACRVTVRGGPDRLPGRLYSFPGDLFIGLFILGFLGVFSFLYNRFQLGYIEYSAEFRRPGGGWIWRVPATFWGPLKRSVWGSLIHPSTTTPMETVVVLPNKLTNDPTLVWSMASRHCSRFSRYLSIYGLA